MQFGGNLDGSERGEEPTGVAGAGGGLTILSTEILKNWLDTAWLPSYKEHG